MHYYPYDKILLNIHRSGVFEKGSGLVQGCQCDPLQIWRPFKEMGFGLMACQISPQF